MGYSTEFKGVLKFAQELTASQLAHLNTILGEDCRDHPEWDAPGLYYVDLKLTEDFSGVRWSGDEKTYDLDRTVNVVIRLMREKYPDFGLSGSLAAQGEQVDDRWSLAIGEDGWAMRINLPVSGPVIECPRCGEKFIVAHDDAEGSV